MCSLSRNAQDFINDDALEALLKRPLPDKSRINDIISKSLAKEPLQLDETADLLLANSPEYIDSIFNAARTLKKDVYGNRIVLFAPLYIGNSCINECSYRGFKRSNKEARRRTLSPEEITQQVKALEEVGHKRLILVYGEHPTYSPEYIAQNVQQVYSIKSGRGEIRRVNINAADRKSVV